MDERAQGGGGRESEWAYIAPRLKERAGAEQAPGGRAGRPTAKGRTRADGHERPAVGEDAFKF